MGCDLPAGRKTCGFLSYNANLGCTWCYSDFGTGVFGKQNYSGFDRSKWTPRDNQTHRKNVQTIIDTTKTEQARMESLFGCRYSCLLQLPYFDPVKMLVIIDPMHNLYLGTAKYIFSNVWLKNN